MQLGLSRVTERTWFVLYLKFLLLCALRGPQWKKVGQPSLESTLLLSLVL
jgi:hypothetical protein